MNDKERLKFSRRDLLKSAAFVGAGMGLGGVAESARLTAAPQTGQGTPPPPGADVSYESMIGVPFSPLETVRVGIIGLGHRGPAHLKDLLTIDHVQVVALCDIVKEKAEMGRALVEKAGQKTPALYTKDEWDFENLCKRDDIDLVYVVTPWAWHAPMCLSALNNGKHVFTEVPGVETIAECWQVVETSEKNRRHCLMLENCCYGVEEMLVLNMIRAGLFGDVEHGEGAYNHDLRAALFHRQKNHVPWRRLEHTRRNGNLYPTHELGPVAHYMDINRGDRFEYMVSMSSVEKGLSLYRAEHVPRGDPQWSESYVCGDVNTSLIKTARGRTIMLQFSTCAPHPYNRINLVQGSKAIFRGWPRPPRIFFSGPGEAIDETAAQRSPEERRLVEGQGEWESLDKYREKYDHPLWREYRKTKRVPISVRAGDWGGGVGVNGGGMDDLMNTRLIQCIRQGLVPDMDVYDLAAWASPGPLSEISVAQGSAPVKFPDFTRGRWNKPRRGPW